MRIEKQGGGWTIISVWEQVHVQSRPNLPLCAVRVEVFRANGQRRYQRPLWLIWTGPAAIGWVEFWRVYLKRFCLECVHQFTKNSLSWTRGRFGYTGREQRWTWMVMLAYWMLLLAAPAARDLCRPWQQPMPAGPAAYPRTGAAGLLSDFLPGWESDPSAKSPRNCTGTPDGLPTAPAPAVSHHLQGRKSGRYAVAKAVLPFSLLLSLLVKLTR